jgi:hypothetical protein
MWLQQHIQRRKHFECRKHYTVGEQGNSDKHVSTHCQQRQEMNFQQKTKIKSITTTCRVNLFIGIVLQQCKRKRMNKVLSEVEMLTTNRMTTFLKLTIQTILCVLMLPLTEASLFATDPIACPIVEDKELERFFSNQLWSKVGRSECVKCHKQGGDAEDTRFVLQDLSRLSNEAQLEGQRANRDAFIRMAFQQDKDKSLLLVKASGGKDHGGQEVLKPGTAGYRILQEFIHRVMNPKSIPDNASDDSVDPSSFFKDIAKLDDHRLLRRATLSLAGRLPTAEEIESIAVQPLSQTPTTGTTNTTKTAFEHKQLLAILDKVMSEDAFYERLREGFNDIFLTLGVDGNPDQTVLSYEHFDKTRGWYQKFDLSHIEDAKERRDAGYKLSRDYRTALLGEPMRLVEHIVRNDRPFTEIVTANYIMVTPYTARGYGCFDQIKDQFKDSSDPFEYIPFKLASLKGRRESENQESESGFYPHAGILSTLQYLSRYPTTETNRNRLRARMYYEHFLGVDVLELAARVSDAAAVTAKFENPTMQASECVVCHKTLDPVAGLFQNFWRFDRNTALYGKRKDGWFTDMFAAGFEGDKLPPQEKWRALQWLGKQTAADSRFATTMVAHAYYLLTGRRPLSPPKSLDDPLYNSKAQAYRAQQHEIQAIATRFVSSNYNFKTVVKDWVVSDFYRADGLKDAEYSSATMASFEDIGIVRMLSPEQLERKVTAIFGKPWGGLKNQTAMLYGGIDSKEVTERAADPSGAMGAIQRTLANDVACRNVALDFSRKKRERILFPNIDPDDIPGNSAATDQKIRAGIIHLHQHVLGRNDAEDSAEVKRTFELLAGVITDAKTRDHFDKREIWSCRQGLEKPVPDPHYTVRAWRAVLTYLLRQHDFLYE